MLPEMGNHMPGLLPILMRPLPILGQLLRDRRGGIAIMLALVLPIIIGCVGLGAEVSAWYFMTRSMQGAADAAAASAAAELASMELSGSSASSAQLRNTGRAVSATLNFTNGSNSTSVTVNNPPATTTNLTSCASPFSAFNCYVEVIIQQPQTPLLSALFMSTGPTISARAVALANVTVADTGCVIALDRSAAQTIRTSGSGNLTFNSCALYDNSSASNALYIGGSGSISSDAAYIVGGVNGSITTTDGTHTGVNPIADPYGNAPSPSAPPTTGTCGTGGTNGQGLDKLFPNGQPTFTIVPTTCTEYGFGGSKDLHLTAGQTLNLCPGTYVFDNGTSLIMDGSSTLNAPPTSNLATLCSGDTTGGVTLIFTNSGGGNPGIMNIGGGATVNLTAPTTGTYSGIAVFQDRLTCTGNGNNNNGCNTQLQAGGNQNITGAIYFPKNSLSYAGGSSTGGAQCTQLIADTITFTGNSTFNSNCSSAGTMTINLTNGTLVM